MPGWEPSAANGVLSGAWSRRDEQAKDSVPGPEVCWDRDGLVAPLGLVDMSEEEKEVICPRTPCMSCFARDHALNNFLGFHICQLSAQTPNPDQAGRCSEGGRFESQDFHIARQHTRPIWTQLAKHDPSWGQTPRNTRCLPISQLPVCRQTRA